jgi:hypothetical protein
LALAVLGLSTVVWAKDDASQSRAKAMRDLAEGVTIESKNQKLAVVDQPAYRWDDPARRFGDGTVWVYGKAGRPAAVLTVALNKNAQAGLEWLHELTALTDTPFTARSKQGWTWSPGARSVSLKPIPNAPAPSSTEPARLRQMGEQARRFKAFELFDPTGGSRAERYELRLLPKPVHRYSDRERGILDGGVFLIAYGQNPEIAMLIEAASTDGTAPRWSYALGRISIATLHVHLDDKELTDWPDDARGFGAQSPYYIFGMPATDADLAR